MKRYKYLFLSILLLYAGCQHDEDSGFTMQRGSHSLVASIEGEELQANTRTAVGNDGQVTWIESDELGVFGSQTRNALFKSTGQGTSVTFTGNLSTKDDEAQWAYYPYDERATLTGQTLTFELPDHYNYTGTSYAPMHALRDANGKFPFRHLCGLLKITLGGGIPENADRLVITSAGENAPSLAGQVTVDDVTAADAILHLPIDGGKTVSYSVENVSPTEEYQTIFVPLPVGQYPKLEVSFYVKDNATPLFTRTISNLNVRRAVMTSVPILNWRTGEQFVLNNATRVLSEINDGTIEINPVDSTSLKYQNVSASDVPTVGEVLWSRVTDEYPNGFLGKVKEVVDNRNGSYTVKTEPAALSEVFDELYVDETVILEPESTVQTRASEKMKVFGFDVNMSCEIKVGNKDEVTGEKGHFWARGQYNAGNRLTATFILNKEKQIERSAITWACASSLQFDFAMIGEFEPEPIKIPLTQV